MCLSGYSFNVEKGLEVKRAGGIGFILQNPMNGIGISVDDHVLPGTAVFSNDSVTILDYIRASNSPTAMLIPPETVLGSRPAPFMAAFSSVGPNGLQPNILKVNKDMDVRLVDFIIVKGIYYCLRNLYEEYSHNFLGWM